MREYTKKHGFIVEAQLMADDVGTLGKSAINKTEDVDGGAFLNVGKWVDNGLYEVTFATDGAKGGLWMAYNPSEHLSGFGKGLFPSLSYDPRYYTNIAGRTFDIFQPQKEDIIGFTDGNIAENQTIAVDSILVVEDGKLKVEATPADGATAFKVVSTKPLPFPQAGIGHEYANCYTCVCLNN